MKSIGLRTPKVDALSKARGQALYTDDIKRPKMLYGKILRSPFARARIVQLDASEAKKFPGVLAILTGKDLPVKYGILPVSQDETALACQQVRYIGEPVAAVAATSEKAAKEAIQRIRVDYEPFEPILSIGQALKNGASPHKAVSLEFGTMTHEKPCYRREDLFFYEGNSHLALEQHCALAQWKDGRLILYSSTQTPFYLKKILAKVLGLPEKDLRIVVPKVGGGFGGKLDPFSHEICAAKLAQLTDRPVKITLEREEVFYCHRGRHPSLMRIQTSWKQDGKLLSLDFKAALDGGAYGSFGVVCTYYHGALQPTTYKIPHYKFEAARFHTNKPPCGPKRGHGAPQPRFALEVHLDKVAEELGIDPVQLRLKNLIEPNMVTVNQLQVTSCGLKDSIEAVVAASDFHKKFRKLPYGKGIGFAVGSYLCGAAVPIYWSDAPHSNVKIELDSKGSVSVYSGATDIGQGSDTVIASIVAQVFGVGLKKIRLVTADTDRTPLDLGSYSSRVTFMAGNAAKSAALNLLEELKTAVGSKDLPFEKMVELAFKKKKLPIRAYGLYSPPPKLGSFKGSGVGPSPAYSFSACVAQVDCESDTGNVRVENITFAHDIGRAINRASVEGQIEGSIYMALGEAFLEEQVFHPDGLHKKPSVLDYKIPTVFEMPKADIILIETEDVAGPFGAKEVGQGPLLPVIPAIANAIYDAVGVRIDETPFTSEKILLALERKSLGKAARVGPQHFPKIFFPKSRLRTGIN